MFANLKIKYKLLWVNFIAIVSVLLVAAVLSIYNSFQSGSDFLERRMQSQAALIANNSQAVIIFDDEEEQRVILSALAADEAVMKAQIFTQDNLVEALFRERRLSTLESKLAYRLFEPSMQMLEVPILSGNEEVASLLIYFHNVELLEAIQKEIKLAAVGLLIALCIGLFLSLMLNSTVTAPIYKLSETTRRIKDSKSYSLRAPLYYRDEIGDLTDDFNAMLGIIDERDRYLEDEVKKRTEELQENYLALQRQTQRRKEIEKNQKELQKRFEEAFFNAPIGMALVNAEGEILQQNDRLLKVIGCEGQAPDNLAMLIGLKMEDGEFIEEFQNLISGKISRFQVELSKEIGNNGKLHNILNCSSIIDEENRFQYAVLQVEDVTESKLLAEKLHFQANHDALTGLPNRRVLKNRLNEITKNQSKEEVHTLCILDLDQFKIVNDTCGHAAGDELLRQLSALVKESLPDKGTFARLGGDEFALLLETHGRPEAEKITELIRQSVEQWDFNWGGQTFRIGVSIGAIVFDSKTEDSSILLQRADSSCFIAKDLGRNRVYITDSENEDVIAQREGEMQWVQKIYEAMEQNRFVLFSQPVVSLRNENGPVRNEILLRMIDRNDSSKLIPPGAFLPAAQRYGLCKQIDKWVLENLIECLKQNPELSEPDRVYWVNLSGNSLSDREFLSYLEKLIENSDFPEGLINFEITETALMQNIALCSVAMKKLKALGCKFALDDFGSGVSSFGYLKNLPVEYLKIDGMFVRDILHDEVDYIFVKSIIDIAKVMGLSTVAEFVESEEVMRRLVHMGADYAQGFHVGSPTRLFVKT